MNCRVSSSIGSVKHCGICLAGVEVSNKNIKSKISDPNFEEWNKGVKNAEGLKRNPRIDLGNTNPIAGVKGPLCNDATEK